MRTLTCGHTRLMVLYWYFNHLDTLPDHSAPLSKSVHSKTVNVANMAVRTAIPQHR